LTQNENIFVISTKEPLPAASPQGGGTTPATPSADPADPAQKADPDNGVGTMEVLLAQDGRVTRVDGGIALDMRVRIRFNEDRIFRPGTVPDRVFVLFEWAIVPLEVLLRVVDGVYEGEVTIVIPDTWHIRSGNDTFTTAVTFTFPENVLADGIELNISPINIQIVPKFDLTVDKTVVDLGEVVYENGAAKSGEAFAQFDCCALNPVEVWVSSDWELKHSHRKSIMHFLVRGDDRTAIKDVDDGNKTFPLEAGQRSFRLYFQVWEEADYPPAAGDYSGTVRVRIESKR
jgi:hypothetical protein